MPSATNRKSGGPAGGPPWYVLAAASCLTLAALAAPAASAVAPPASGCAAVNIITARASTEAAGEGITGSLVTQIVNSSTQTVSHEAVVYPATLTNYASSESQGVTNAEQELTTAVRTARTRRRSCSGTPRARKSPWTSSPGTPRSAAP